MCVFRQANLAVLEKMEENFAEEGPLTPSSASLGTGGGSNLSFPTNPRGSSGGGPATPRDKGGPGSPRGAFATPKETNAMSQHDDLAVFSPLRLRNAVLRRISSVFDDWTAAPTHPFAVHQREVEDSRASNAVAAISAIAGGGNKSSHSNNNNTVFSAYAGASFRRSQSLQLNELDSSSVSATVGSGAAGDSEKLPAVAAEAHPPDVSSPKCSRSSNGSSNGSSSVTGRPSPSSVEAVDSAASAAAAKAEQAAGADVKKLVWKVIGCVNVRIYVCMLQRP